MPVALRVQAPPPSQVGDLVPALTPHAVSVALPKWQDNVDYEEGAQRIKDAMTSGYPRFFIHHQIQQLADLATSRFGRDGPDGNKETCILLPTEKTARSCSDFLSSREKPVSSRVQSWSIESTKPAADGKRSRIVTVWACFFPESDFSVAKQYWQHTGEGISSRVAERCLVLLGEIETADPATTSTSTSSAVAPPTIGDGQTDATHYFVAEQAATGSQAAPGAAASRYGNKGGRYQVAKGTSTVANGTGELSRPPSTASKQRYSTTKVPGRRGSADASPQSSSLSNSIDQLPPPPVLSAAEENGRITNSQLVEQDEDVLARYVEERYGRNLDLSLAPLAKLAMRRRIAGVLSESPGEELAVDELKLEGKQVDQQESSRGVKGLTEDDVWLYPCGMNAIFHAHQLAMHAWQREGRQVGKSVCFG
jgi:cystathionine gamma-synthase